MKRGGFSHVALRQVNLYQAQPTETVFERCPQISWVAVSSRDLSGLSQDQNRMRGPSRDSSRARLARQPAR
eukprot:84350-Prymnesium_polylepis.1